MLDMSTTVSVSRARILGNELTSHCRKKRCDLGYPVCAHCVRLNYKCKWEEPRPLVQENTLSTEQVSNQPVNAPFRLSQVPDPILFWVDDHSDNTSRSSRRHFLRYYAQTFTHMLTTNIENNSFLSGELIYLTSRGDYSLSQSSFQWQCMTPHC